MPLSVYGTPLRYMLFLVSSDDAYGAARVIEMRFRMIAIGKAPRLEMFFMVTEKLDAMTQAKAIVIRGGDPSLIIDNYRKIVDVARLSDT
jgi:hypothetical protein